MFQTISHSFIKKDSSLSSAEPTGKKGSVVVISGIGSPDGQNGSIPGGIWSYEIIGRTPAPDSRLDVTSSFACRRSRRVGIK